MKRFIQILCIVALTLLVLFIAPSLIGEKGYVLIAIGRYTVEFTVVSAIVILTLGLLGLFIAFKLLKVSVLKTLSLRFWYANVRYKRQNTAFYNGIFELLIGHQTEAEKHLKQIKDDRFHGFHYLALAQIAHANSDHESAKAWYDKAQTHSDKRCVRAATLIQARNLILQNQPHAALDMLETLNVSSTDVDSSLIKLKAQALASANEWQQLEESLPTWKKRLGEDYLIYNERLAVEKFAEIASKHGANQLKIHWDALPRQARNDDAHRSALLNQLLLQDMHNDAHDYLVQWYKKKSLPLNMLASVRNIRVPNPAKLISLLETSIKANPEEAQYYAALGHLAYHSNDLALSEKALNKALALRETETEWALLAEIYQTNNAFEQAMHALRRVNALHS